jgi:hypothetical protein
VWGLVVVGCDGAADPVGETCGANATYNEDHGHCHCDEGYEIDGVICVPASEEPAVPAEVLSLEGAVVTGESFTDEEGQPGYMVQAVVGDVVLTLEGFVGLGAPDAPATVSFADHQLDYATCDTCLRVETGCEAHGDHFHCDDVFMPKAGEVTYSALDPAGVIVGALRGVQLRPVKIARDLSTRPKGEDGPEITAWPFEVDLAR